MGCGGSKEQASRTSSRKYLAGHAGNDAFQGIQLYSAPAGPLTAKDYKERLVTSEGTQSVTLPRSGYTIRYAYVSQRGYYPDSPDKANQDSFCVHTAFNGDPEQHLFGVFDGHGDCGTQSSQFARDKVPLNLLSSAHFASNPALALHQAMVATNLQCHRSDFDDSMSGTTAITVLIRGRSLLVANVGDSRAVLAEKVPGGGYIAKDLSIDQTPYRRDECERVRAAGARVLTLDQIEGLKDPTVECWTTEEEDDGDPPRLWFPNGMYPGTAFTRSIGDAAAERIGVFAEPELEFRYLKPNDAFIVIASDGVFEFISSQRVVDMVAKFDDPHEACLSVVAESYRLWLQYETRTDDITMIMLQLVGLDQPSLSRLSLTPTYQPSLATLSAATAAAAAAQQQQQQDEQEAAAAAAVSAAAADQQAGSMPLGLLDVSQPGGALVQPSGLMFPMRGHLVEDIEAYNLAAGPQQQLSSDGSLTTISTWFHSHNFRAPEVQQLGTSGPEQIAPTGPAAASAAAAAAAAAAAGAEVQQLQQQSPVQLDLGQITPEQYRMLEETVRNNFLFSHLSEADRLAIYKSMERIEVQPNDVIIHQGERGDHFYIVESGVYDVMVLTSSEFCQPQCIEQDCAVDGQQPPPPASEVNQQSVNLDQQQHEHLQHQIEQQQHQQQAFSSQLRQRNPQDDPAISAATPSMSSSRADSVFKLGAPSASSTLTAPLSQAGSMAEHRRHANILLDNDMMASMAATAADEALMNAYGDEDGMTGGGSIASTNTQPAETGLLGGIQTEWGELVHTYVAPPMQGPDAGGPHPSFGELALLYGKPRAATVVSQTPGVVWRLSRQAFRAALQSARGDPGNMVLHTLRSCELLDCLTNGQLVMLADLLQPRIYEDGDYITQQGETGEATFFIVAQGEVVANVRRTASASALNATTSSPQTPGLLAATMTPGGSTNGITSERSVHGGTVREVLTMGPGAFFGEKNFRGDMQVSWPASMVARGKTLLLAVSRQAFEATFGPLSALAADHAAWRVWLGNQKELLSRSVVLGKKYEQLLAGKFDPQALRLRGCLWMLSDAAVLASLEEPHSELALTGRLLSVEGVERRGLSQAIVRMRKLTSELPPCLFVPHTVAAWCSPATGQAVVAGEALATVGVCTLAALLQGGPLDERSASYVTAMAILGLSHLHRLGIAYRGLSAITLLVTEGGLVQLVDFRFAKAAEGRTFTLCGVPEYLAPEVVGGTGHDESVDWWALGVLVFHLITGGTPFARLGDDELRIYRRILRATFRWPDTPAGHDISADARDLVAQLLQRDPAKRLGMGRGGVAKLRSHPWFRWINWQDLQEGRTMVPLGLRERLFHSAGGGELGFWAPAARQPGAPNPTWLDEF